MILSNHHILYDGWSSGIILKEFFNAYHNIMGGKKLQVPVKTKFKEFVKIIQRQAPGKQQEFWQKHLRGLVHLFCYSPLE